MLQVTGVVMIIIICSFLLVGIKVHETFFQTNVYTVNSDNIDLMQKFGNGYIVSPYMRVHNTISIGENNEASIDKSGTLNAKKICVNGKCTDVGFDNDSINGIKLSGSWSDTTGYGRSEISNDFNSMKGLVIAGNTSSGTGKRVIIKDNLNVSGDLKTFKTTDSSRFVSGKDGLTVKNKDNDMAIIGYRSDGSFGIITTSDKPTKISHNDQNSINMYNENTLVNRPILHNNTNDGVIIEKRSSARNKYGVAKQDTGLILYGPEPSSVSTANVRVGFASGDNNYDTALTVKHSGDVVARNRLCVNTTCFDEPDLIRMKTPPPPPKFSQLCLDDTCLSRKELSDLKSLLTSSASLTTSKNILS